MGRMGNTFGSQTVSAGHARKVWREVKDQYPVGGVVVNLSDWLTNSKGKIPAGTPAKWYNDSGAKKVVCYTDAQIAASLLPTYTEVAEPTGNPKTKGYYEYDDATHEYVATNDTSVTDNKKYYEKHDAAGVASLGINGYTLYDIDIENGDTIGTATVVYAGEIYEYMLDSDTAATLKNLSTTPQIVYVS